MKKLSWFNFFSKGQQAGAIAKKDIQKSVNLPDFPYLVSFPRTGSHWLRMMIEGYSNRPLLVRSFYDHDNVDYLLYHTHDMNLDVKRNKVIYLYRYPTDVIYSQLRYYKQDRFNKTLISFWSYQYACHLANWVFTDNTENKEVILIKYEGLKHNLTSEIKKITDFLGLSWDEDKLKKVSFDISKAKVQEKSNYNQQVINTTKQYQEQKEDFVRKYDEYIRQQFSLVSKQIFANEGKIWELFDE